jgi:DNA-binding NtrC family response regulator
VDATKIGAFDFLEKPIGLSKLLSDHRACAQERGRAGTAARVARGAGREPADPRDRARARADAGRATPILILGEAGTGH